MRGSFEAKAGAGVDPELSLLENVIAVPRFGAVEEHFPFHGQIRNVECIEERQCGQATVQIEIDKHEVCAHGTISVLSMGRSRMTAERIGRINGIETKHEIIVDRQITSATASL